MIDKGENKQDLLDKSLETLEKLRPACVDTGMSYEERVARREAEIEALKNALCVLDEEVFLFIEIDSCIDPSFTLVPAGSCDRSCFAEL